MKKTLLVCIIAQLYLSAFGQEFEGVSPAVYIDIKEDAAPVATTLSFNKLRNVGNSAIAVIIGNKDYDEFGEVAYAQNDATLMNELLTKSFGFKNENIELIENAPKKKFDSWFGNVAGNDGKLADKIVPGVTKEVWVYYSGHAGPNGNKPTDKKAYLMAKDTEKNAVGNTGYPLETLYKNLSKLPVEKVVVILDACFSGRELGYTNSATIQVDDPFKNAPLSLQNGVVLTAAGANEFATWDEENQHGTFTYEMVKAIQDGKRCDKNGDGNVSFAELISELNDNVKGVPAKARKQSKNQRPTVKGGKANTIFFVAGQ